MKKIFSNKAGFLMVEVLIVASVIVLIVLGAMTVAQKSIFISRQSISMTQASFLLEEGAEVSRILRDQDWSNISSLDLNFVYYPTFNGTVWSLSTTPNTVGPFTRTLSIQNVARDSVTGDISVSGVDDPNTKLITITVSWQEGGDTISKTLSFYIVNIFS